MKKLFKKIRLWLIKKLKAIPEENTPCIRHTTMPIVTLESCETIDHYRINDEKFIAYCKKSVANKLAEGLIENELIEFTNCDNYEYMERTLRGRLLVAKGESNG